MCLRRWILGCIFATALAASSARAASFAVNDVGDLLDATPGDGLCEIAPDSGICTLRAAIQEANALAGADQITLGQFVLPLGDAGWIANNDGVAKFVNTSAPGGSTQAKVSVLKPGKLVKLVGKGLGDVPFDILMAGAPVDGVSTSYCVTNAGTAYCHCATFEPANCAHKLIAGNTGAKLVCKGGVSDPACSAVAP